MRIVQVEELEEGRFLLNTKGFLGIPIRILELKASSDKEAIKAYVKQVWGDTIDLHEIEPVKMLNKLNGEIK